MAQFIKPSNLNNVWASGGDRIYPGDTKYATGWQVEIPPRQYFNEIDYKQDQMLAHLNQHGIPVWDSETEYQADQSYVQGSTGTVYRCILTHGGTTGAAQNPDLDVSNTYWIIAFASAGDFYTATESDARYAQLSNNGSDYNAATFRTNLSVYSKAESYTKSEVDSKVTVASQAQAENGTSNAVLMTPLRTEQWGSQRVVGLGQTWQNLTGSRSLGTTYTNTTGRPIMVNITPAQGAGGRGDMIVGGVVVGSYASNSTGYSSTLSAIVPHGATYRYTVTSGTQTLSSWAELR